MTNCDNIKEYDRDLYRALITAPPNPPPPPSQSTPTPIQQSPGNTQSTTLPTVVEPPPPVTTKLGKFMRTIVMNRPFAKKICVILKTLLKFRSNFQLLG